MHQPNWFVSLNLLFFPMWIIFHSKRYFFSDHPIMLANIMSSQILWRKNWFLFAKGLQKSWSIRGLFSLEHCIRFRQGLQTSRDRLFGMYMLAHILFSVAMLKGDSRNLHDLVLWRNHTSNQLSVILFYHDFS